jgi:hypothetical protein
VVTPELALSYHIQLAINNNNKKKQEEKRMPPLSPSPSFSSSLKTKLRREKN